MLPGTHGAGRRMRVAARGVVLRPRREGGVPMAQVKVSEPVNASADQVWALLGDFGGGPAKWGGPMIESCRVEGSGVGAVRTIGLPGGATIQERCEGYDAAGRA